MKCRRSRTTVNKCLVRNSETTINLTEIMVNYQEGKNEIMQVQVITSFPLIFTGGLSSFYLVLFFLQADL